MKQGNLFGGPIDYSKPTDITANRHGGNPQSEAAHNKVQPTAAAERARVLKAFAG